MRLIVLVACLLAGPVAGFAQAAKTTPASTLRQADLRLATLAYRMARDARALCPEAAPVTGMLFHHLPEYDAAGRRLMIDRHALDRGPGVLAVVADGPAARAGILAGDVLLTVNGLAFADPRRLAAEKRREVWRAAVEASEAQVERALQGGPAQLLLLRQGRELTLELMPDRGCALYVRLARSRQANAFATARYVVVTSRIMDFVQSDDELAVVVGHEFAHILLGHAQRLEDEHVPDGLLRGFGKNAARVRATEEEADRLGLKLAAAAGYDVKAAIPFWRRFYAAFAGGPQIFRTHPGLKARERLIEDTIAQIGPR